jgi:glycosyltransferase involved in cell wall biosynthesis
MMSSNPDVSIVLPVYNQADHIQHIVTGYLTALDSLKYSVEILLVVNASRDGSLESCQRMEQSDNRVRVLHSDEAGWGRAVRKGLAASRGKIVGYTNSARTTSYTLALHIMLATANPGLVVKANRRMRHPLFRRMGSVLYNFQCRNLFDLPVWDINGTPKFFSKEISQELDLQENGDLIDLELIVRCKQAGVQILEVPIVSTVRHGGESTTNLASAFKMYWGVFQMRHRVTIHEKRDEGRED